MFKKGDIVVCIDNEEFEDILILYKRYIIDSCAYAKDLNLNIKINISTPIIILEGVNAAFTGGRFRTLIQLRKEKIEKLNGINR